MRVLALSLLLGCRSKGTTNVDEEPLEADPAADSDGDGYDTSEDCDDADGGVHPGVAEICDGIDNDCDGTADEDVTDTFYADADGDGFGNEAEPLDACEAPAGYAAVGSDCDDEDPDTYPGAPERCDGLDNDCDTAADEDVTSLWYADVDADGYGDPELAAAACDPQPGYIADNSDCDDTDPAVFPGGAEVCDEADNDCDGATDEGVTTTYYADIDGDGFGVDDKTAQSCDLLTGYAAAAGDCDDAAAAINPAADEVCDEQDNDCDGVEDEGVTSAYYADADGDGYGDAGSALLSCAPPAGYVADDADCDDAAAAVSPGSAEVCDERDNDCDGVEDEGVTSAYYADADGDGYGSGAALAACDLPAGASAASGDCDDGDASANPAASELCDGADDDCDGLVDEGSALDAESWYADSDGDGYGNSGVTAVSCEAPSGYVAADADCDDADGASHPGGSEVCDDADNDCDGSSDEGASDAGLWYADSDGDGYGNSGVTAASCEAPSGYVAVTGPSDADCDDGAAGVYPGASEVCDGVDQDCDGVEDEGVTSTYYADADGDGYGNAGIPWSGCAAPAGYVGASGDCDDGAAGVHPGGSEVCDAADNDCDGSSDEDPALLGEDPLCAASNCQEILDMRPGVASGAYWIDLAGSPAELWCDQSTDGGGWTLVGSFLYPGSAAGVSGWASAGRVGAPAASAATTFKLSDAEINDLVTSAYRARGTATGCLYGGCAVDITLYWSASCAYNSAASSTGACAQAYRDASLTSPTGWSTPCSWHYGLTSVACGTISEMGTSHSGHHVFAGYASSWNHAYSGRSGENPSLWLWVR